MKAVQQHGFTLIELTVTIAVAAVLLSIAAPSFKEFMAGQRLRTVSSSLHSDLLRGRSEAINRNASIVLVPVVTGNWSKGWRICTASDCTTIIGTESQLDSNLSIGAGGKTEIKFLPNGRVQETVSFQFSSSAYTGTPWCVNITTSGQPVLVHQSC